MISRVLMLFGIFFIIGLAFYGAYLRKVKGAGKKKWELLLYLFVAGLLFGLSSKLGFFEFTKLPLWFFMIAQLWLLIVGVLHVWLFGKLITLESSNLGKILFTMAIFFIGYGVVILSFLVYFKSPFPRLYFIPGFFFLAPTFIMIAFNSFIKIPVKVFKLWDFPAPGTLPDPKDSEMADLIIVNFEIRKQSEDNRTVFKAKAPRTMALGKLFYFFIGDYNSRNPNHPILINDSDNKLFKWSFYQASNIFKCKRHLDPELTVAENKIKENSSIICDRFIP